MKWRKEKAPEWWPNESKWPPVLIEDEKKPRKMKIFKRVLLGMGVFLLALVGFAYWQIKSTLNDFQEGYKAPIVEEARPELNIPPAKPLPGLKEATTFLIIGSDIRPEAGEEWGRSDTIILARIYPEENAVSLLSLPRDLMVEIPDIGTDKINAAYSYGGPSLLIATVREYLGVPINHFFQVDFEGFGKLVEEIGGAYIPVDQRYFHSNEGLYEYEHYSEIDLKPGYQYLDAYDALAFVRYRHGDSDFIRAARQQLFLREVGRQVGLLKDDPLEVRDFLKAVAKAAISDLSSVGESLKLANTLRQIPSDRIARVTLEADDVYYNGAYYLQASEAQKESALKDWTNPDHLFKEQRRKPPPKASMKAFVNVTSSLRRSARIINPWLEVPLAHLDVYLQERTESERVRRVKPEKIKKKEEKARLIPTSQGAKITGHRKGINNCHPTALPEGFAWPDREEARHAYELEGEPALAVYATKGSGESILWMFTSWQFPPILENPTDAIEMKGKRYEMFWESGNLRIISWRSGNTRAWITNTLGNELSPEQMLALARTCNKR